MYKTKKTAKFLSCLLVLMMILTIAPVSVMAVDPFNLDTQLKTYFGSGTAGANTIITALRTYTTVTSAKDVTELDAALAGITSLDLSNPASGEQIDDTTIANAITGFGKLTGLTSLDISNNGLSTISAALPGITATGLFRLSVNNNSKKITSVVLSAASRLTYLSMTNNSADTALKMDTLTSTNLPTTLQMLDITGQRIDAIQIQAIKTRISGITIVGADLQANYLVENYSQVSSVVATAQTFSQNITVKNLNGTEPTVPLQNITVKSSTSAAAVTPIYANSSTKDKISGIVITPLYTGYMDLQLCDSSGTVIKTLQTNIYISRNPITSVSIIGAVTNIPLGTSLTLLAAVSPYMVTPPVRWDTSNPSVLTITQAGTIAAVGYGYSTITLTTTDGSNKSATALINVIRPVDYITLSQTSLTMYTNQETKLTATCAPDTATNKTVTWDSSNPGTVSVNYLGELTALRAGTTTVTATTTDGTNKKASCIVTVSSTPLTVTILPRELSMNTGENTTLTATVTPSIVENKAVTWTSSNNMVAVVDSTGKIFALREGSAMITATSKEDPKKAAYCMLTVKDRNKPVVPTYDVTLNRDTASIQYGNRYRLKAYFDGELASYGDVRWTSSNARIARVTSYGNVYGDDCGKATIYARDPQTNAVLAKCTVTIKPRTGEINLSKYGSSAIKVDYDETEGSTYYRIYYKEGLYGTYRRAATTTNLSTVKYGLTRGQTYYFKMRSYTTVGGQNIYSNYSKTAKLTLR